MSDPTLTDSTSRRADVVALANGPNRRRCLTADEMRGKGMTQNARNHWTNGGISPWSKET